MIGVTLELLNIRDDNIRLFQVRSVRCSSPNFHGFGVRATGEYLAFLVEHARVRGIEVGGKLIGNRKTRCNDQSTIGTKSKGVKVMQPDFPQPTGSTIPTSRSVSSGLLA